MIKRRSMIGSGAGGAAVALGTAGLATPALAQQTFRLRLQSWTWPALEQHRAVQEWVQRVAQLTNNRLQIELFAREAVVPHWEAPDAVSRGLLDATMEWPGNWASRDVGFNIFTPPPMTLDEGWQLDAWFYDRGALDQMREAFAQHNVHIAGVTYWQKESLHSRRPLPNIQALRGMSVRTPQGIIADYFRRLGATPVVLPPPEVYGALERGVVDAAEFLTPSAHLSLGYQRVARYMLWPSPHQGLATIYVGFNRRSWDRLPADIRAIVESSIREFSHAHAVRPLVSDFASLARYREAGNVLVRWSDEDWAFARRTSRELYREYGGQSRMAARAIESLDSFLDVLGLAG
jgi:TRAP-type mannitol/chloroaromatic compound transport system substrate-binding protein